MLVHEYVYTYLSAHYVTGSTCSIFTLGIKTHNILPGGCTSVYELPVQCIALACLGCEQSVTEEAVVKTSYQKTTPATIPLPVHYHCQYNIIA